MSHRFTKDLNGYVFLDGNNQVVYSTEDLAFLVDMDVGCYLKHGPLLSVVNYCTSMRHQAKAGGVEAMFSNLVIVSGKEWDVDLLNWFLGGVTRIGDFLRKEVVGEPWKDRPENETEPSPPLQ